MGESEDGKVQELPVESYNFANSTKWVFNIPFGRLFNAKYGNIKNGYILDYPLNCKSVSFPEFRLRQLHRHVPELLVRGQHALEHVREGADGHVHCG